MNNSKGIIKTGIYLVLFVGLFLPLEALAKTKAQCDSEWRSNLSVVDRDMNLQIQSAKSRGQSLKTKLASTPKGQIKLRQDLQSQIAQAAHEHSKLSGEKNNRISQANNAHNSCLANEIPKGTLSSTKKGIWSLVLHDNCSKNVQVQISGFQEDNPYIGGNTKRAITSARDKRVMGGDSNTACGPVVIDKKSFKN
jgi:hypothetical protein